MPQRSQGCGSARRCAVPRRSPATFPIPVPGAGKPPGSALFRARPPYAYFVPASTGATPVLGDVYAVLISDDTDPSALRRTTWRVRRLAQPASVVATYRGHRSDGTGVTRVASSAGLGLVELNQDPLEPSLRRALTDPEQLPGAFRQWLRSAGITADPRLVSLLGDIIEQVASQWESGAPADGIVQAPTVQEMASIIDLSSRGLREAFARNHLPSPVQWKILARSLVHALVIQRHPDVPVTRLALTLGYADSQALSHTFHDRFGITPTFARERLGWEWLALRWRERHAGV